MTFLPFFKTAKGASSLLLVMMVFWSASYAKADRLLLQSTTSTLNSGLYDHILPLFEADTGLRVHVVAVGTGKALANGRNCNGDALLIHATDDERQFVNQGYGLYRQNVMYNDFVIVGPKADAALIRQAPTALAAFERIANANAFFASRADDSGTHKAETAIWHATSRDPVPASGTWYLETGTGMGATLNLAVEKGAYTLSDRATWIAFSNKQSHEILFEGDARLFNQYGIIPIAKSACPASKQDEAILFADWLTSERGQRAIASYRKLGIQLFVPNAR